MKNLWKIERDSYYSELYKEHGLDFILKSGFFFDTDKVNRNLNNSISVLCTPITRISEQLDIHSEGVVLLSTGSMCPVHSGHIDIMELAKKEIESQGINVLGGFISPGHDEYISSKNKELAIPIHYRIRAIEEMTRNIDWLTVDPWEGVFNNVAVNFTDVIKRLELYLELHLDKKIEVIFVCGGDNAKFAKTFLNKGRCVVVSRPSYNLSLFKIKDEIGKNDRIIWAEGLNESSSTKIRNESGPLVLDKQKKLNIRCENRAHEKDIIDVLKPYYTRIKRMNLDEQLDTFDRFYKENTYISLDCLINSDQNLKISRQYDLFGANMLRFSERPGSEKLNKQVAKIRKGNYILFDDDIAGGSTMRFTKALLEDAGLTIDGILSLNISSPETGEILDCRDFILGSEEGGLVIKLPYGQLTRALYVYPYVCPFMRASISNPMQFSIDVWQMNMNIFEYNTNVKLKDIPEQCGLFRFAGFDMENSVYDICKWHRDYLIELSK